MAHYQKIIVGVDYGTTFTGVSWVDSSKEHVNDINVIRTWPGPTRDQDECDKMPSRIAYGADNPSTMPKNETRWGYMVVPKMKSYTWTKLLLDPDSKMTSGSTGTDIIEGNGLLRLPSFKSKASEVCADFLRSVYEYTMEILVKRLGSPVVNMTVLEFWFTVPAIWSEKAKEETWKAAKSAGFGSRAQDNIFMITEPEAAAVALLSDVRHDFTAKVGSGVLVCDCGGGTVDIVTYKVTQLKPILRFEELLPGTGEKCGSTYIDREFYKWMSKSFGSAFDNMNPEKKGPGSRFMRDFESNKKDFRYKSKSNQRFEMELVIPGAKHSEIYDQENSEVILTSRIMESFFQPIVERIKRMLHDQLEQLRKKSNVSIQAILLVGGFGDSPYLNDSLREWCKSHGGIHLVCPEHPQASVVKGAALRGLKGLVPEKRIARVNYGMTVMLPFREQVDPEESIVYWEWDGEKHCNNRMNWLINKGDEITPDNCPMQELLLLYKKGDTLSFSREICISTEDTAPEWWLPSTIREVATINYTFSESDLSLFPVKKRPFQRDMYALKISVQVNALANEGFLEFRIIGPGGRDMGKASVAYD